MMNDIERKIREERTIEATRKGYTGGSGRFGVIAKNLGQNVLVHGGGNSDVRSLPDFYNYLDDESNEFWDGKSGSYQKRLPYMGDPNMHEEPTGDSWRHERDYEIEMPSIYSNGWYFQGLSSGMDLEIKYEPEGGEIAVRHKGKIVYKETSGEIEAFIPNEEWENQINLLYDLAKSKEKKALNADKTEKIKNAKIEKASWIDRMKRQWGI